MPFSAVCEAFADSTCVGLDDAAARAFGALREAKQLVWLRSLGPKRAEATKTAAEAKLHDIGNKIRDLTAMRAALASLVESCRRSGGPITCPILEALENSSPGP